MKGSAVPGTVESLFGIDVPIVLGPFGGLSSPGLTAIVSERGGLGSYGLYGYPPERIRETITRLRSRARSMSSGPGTPYTTLKTAGAASITASS